MIIGSAFIVMCMLKVGHVYQTDQNKTIYSPQCSDVVMHVIIMLIAYCVPFSTASQVPGSSC